MGGPRPLDRQGSGGLFAYPEPQPVLHQRYVQNQQQRLPQSQTSMQQQQQQQRQRNIAGGPAYPNSVCGTWKQDYDRSQGYRHRDAPSQYSLNNHRGNVYTDCNREDAIHVYLQRDKNGRLYPTDSRSPDTGDGVSSPDYPYVQPPSVQVHYANNNQVGYHPDNYLENQNAPDNYPENQYAEGAAAAAAAPMTNFWSPPPKQERVVRVSVDVSVLFTLLIVVKNGLQKMCV